MTNGDHIRQMMTDEYIAQEFCGIAGPFSRQCDDCPLYENPKCEQYEERIKWLKEEYAGEKEKETEVEYSDFCDEKVEMLSEIGEIRYILSDLVKRIEKMEEKLS